MESVELEDNIVSLTSALSDVVKIGSALDASGDKVLAGYRYPEGKHICQLQQASKFLENDLLLVSTMSGDVPVASKKISYADLRNQLVEDVLAGLGVKSMAYERKQMYALTSHEHDALYTRAEWTPNPWFDKCKDSAKVKIAALKISTETLSSTDVSANPASSAVSCTSNDIWCPTLVIPLPPRPEIGTLKFVTASSLQKLVAQMSLSTSAYGSLVNVNPYDQDGKIRDDYDGWVFPNGMSFSNVDGQLSAAAKAFAGSATAETFTVPCISDFIQAYSSSGSLSSGLSKVAAQVGLKPHLHTVGELEFKIKLAELYQPDDSNYKIWSTSGFGGGVWIHQGNFTGKGEVVTIDGVTANLGTQALKGVHTSKASTASQDPYPTHSLIPLMIYIGGESLSYYEKL